MPLRYDSLSEDETELHELPFPKKEPRELPFDPDLAFHSDVDPSFRLGLGRATTSGHQAMRMAMLANLALALMQGSGVGVHYSRDDAHYARHRRWVPRAYTRRNVVTAVHDLASARIVRHEQVAPSPRNTRRSVVFPLITLDVLGAVRVIDLVSRLSDPIELKNAEKSLLPYHDTAFTRSLRADVQEQNALLDTLHLNLSDAQWQRDAHGLFRHTGKVVNPTHVQLYRVFNNGVWSHGGRFYGGWWQGLPKTVRAHLLIDGEAVCEEDYSACHLRILSAVGSMPLPDGDPYQLDTVDRVVGDPRLARKLIKSSFQILINAKTAKAAHGAISNKIDELGLETRLNSKLTMRAIKARFIEFESFWHTGLGSCLQRIDSDMAADVMRQLRAKAVPALSVHDSFVVPANARLQLLEVMERAFAAGLRRAPAILR